MKITGDYHRDMLENIALEWEADIQFNRMRDGSEPGPHVKILPREQCDRETTENRIRLLREIASRLGALEERALLAERLLSEQEITHEHD